MELNSVEMTMVLHHGAECSQVVIEKLYLSHGTNSRKVADKYRTNYPQGSGYQTRGLTSSRRKMSPR